MKDNFKEVEIDQFKDEDVIRGLGCCAADDGDDCFQCPYGNIVYKPGNGGCVNRCRKDALDLINRQKAEIERLQEYYKMYFDQKIEINDKQIEIDYMQDKYSLLEENIKKLNSEAIKRFAERLKARLTTLEYTKETDKRTVMNEMTEEVQK